MSDIPGRVYRVAKAYLDAARDRLGEIDSLAQEELSRSLSRDDIRIPDPPPASSNDPLERARAKIAAAQQTMTAQREVQAASARAAAPAEAVAAPTVTDPVQTAYKIIGVAPGSDYVTVQQAVTKLRERCAPTRFPDGSQEQAETRVILQRVEEAFQVLSNTLNPGAGRFDKLEF
jgi:hypothetical protein